jgi:ribosome-associated protein
MLEKVTEYRNFSSEFSFITSRSQGPGGQNVNKVSTKVELRFDVVHSALITDDEKEILMIRLKNKITQEGVLIVVSQNERTQLKNKEKAIEKFILLIDKALTPRKARKKTKPTPGSREKRLEDKRILAEKKNLRKVNRD